LQKETKMKFIADLHIHSHYSRATSKDLVPEYLDYHARLKGITVIGTGDFTHPGWTKELKEKLEPAEDGLFKLKPTLKNDNSTQTPFLPESPVRFMLTAEISNIYKKNDKVRKVHNLIFAPDFKTVDKIQQKLTAIDANITSDGRPILGLDSRNLLEMMLECSENIFFTPAHVWTPWFSALGSKSGFDSIEECYADLSHHIHAVETGLSTDPPMHWMCSFLDKYTLISNSDAHSLEKLGRNATCFDTELSYIAMIDALKTGNPERFGGTIDLFPQEGKYHYDGHRKCGICWDPVQTLKNNSRCTVCRRPVTVGVMNRVVQLSDRENLEERPNRAPFYSIIPLREILAEIEGVGPNSKRVDTEYFNLLKTGHPELEILLDIPFSEIERIGAPQLAEAVRRMRNREVRVKEGYDGEYGVITVFEKNEIRPSRSTAQGFLFDEPAVDTPSGHTPPPRPERRKIINFDLSEYRLLQKRQPQSKPLEETDEPEEEGSGLNPEQLAAVNHFNGPALVIAGPGTGKTRVLTYRILHLVKEKNIDPETILAVTFTNKAAAEIEERLEQLLEKGTRPRVTTFHSLGYTILREKDVGKRLASSNSGATPLTPGNNSEIPPIILDSEDKKRLIQYRLGVEKRQVNKISDAITEIKQQLKTADEIEDETTAAIFRRYQSHLKELNAVDLDDLVYLPVLLLSKDQQLQEHYRQKFRWLLVDEYQDVNLAQYRLIRLLMPTGDNPNLCVIGDPDQAIYGFRGADVRFINAFKEDYPDAVLFKLRRSYRCTDSILLASGRVIRGGKAERETGMLKGMSKGVKIKIVKNSTDRSEAEFVARTVEEMMGGLRFFSMDSSITQGNQDTGNHSLSDFVVLCRVRAQMEAIEKALNDHAVPYQVIGDTPFFQQEPVKSVIDVLRLSVNPTNEFLKMKLIDKHIANPLELSSLLEQIREQPTIGAAATFIIEHCFSPSEGDQAGNEALFKRLLHFAGQYQSGSDGREAFLKFAALGTAADTYRPDMENVTLMTLHAAKGLEFKCVFIVGCEDGLLPYSLFSERVSDPAEERRLLYVGMTRAEKFLFLTHAEKRRLGGREYHLKRSSFLDNIEKELIELSHARPVGKETTEPVQRSLFD
jgi:DNA helicase-2/ATP-dependent DNA helicase PcrA